MHYAMKKKYRRVYGYTVVRIIQKKGNGTAVLGSGFFPWSFLTVPIPYTVTNSGGLRKSKLSNTPEETIVVGLFNSTFRHL